MENILHYLGVTSVTYETREEAETWQPLLSLKKSRMLKEAESGLLPSTSRSGQHC